MNQLKPVMVFWHVLRTSVSNRIAEELKYPLNVMEKLLLRCADRLIIPSPYVKELVECLRLNNSVFYLPIPFEKKLCQKLNPQEGRLLFVGTVEKS